MSAGFELRGPRDSDAAAIAELLAQLGYATTPEQVTARLAALAGSSDPILIAADGEHVLGLIALHWTPMLFAAAPVARITTLVVDRQGRGRGLGRCLVEAGADLAREAGCGVLELTTALHRHDAQAFYRSIGFTASSLRLHRDVGQPWGARSTAEQAGWPMPWPFPRAWRRAVAGRGFTSISAIFPRLVRAQERRAPLGD